MEWKLRLKALGKLLLWSLAVIIGLQITLAGIIMYPKETLSIFSIFLLVGIVVGANKLYNKVYNKMKAAVPVNEEINQ